MEQQKLNFGSELFNRHLCLYGRNGCIRWKIELGTYEFNSDRFY